MSSAHDFDLAATRQRSALAVASRDDRQLIRCATLAASSHNTQPWTFEVAPDDVAKLERAGRGFGVRTVTVTDPARIAAISDLVARGNEVQLNDRRFRRELVSWIRFNPTTALRRGDGLAGRCSANPSMPTWLGRLLAPVVIRARSQSERDTTNIRSSAGIAVVVTEHDDRAAWTEAGRAYERFALQATALDIRTAFVNQPIEVPSLRGELETLLGLDDEVAQLAVRFGHGGLAPFSLRRDLDEVLGP